MMTTMTSADQWLRDAVTRHLAWEPELDPSIIVVSAQAGIVTLTGYVETYAAKATAERTASEVYGVRTLANDLQVRVALHGLNPDAARDTVEALKSHGDVRPALSVAVEHLREARLALDQITARPALVR